MSDRTTRLVAVYAALAALAAACVSPLLALAYMRTSEGADELHTRSVSWWASPAFHHLGGLVTWASPDRVYATYTQAMALLFPAVILCALALRRRRRGAVARRPERWGWGIALAGYGIFSLGLLAASLVLIHAHADSPTLNVVFLTLMLPGMLLSLIGSTALGITLLHSGYRPRATGWLLALAIPLLAAGQILGHNSLGIVPPMIAWGITGLDLRRRHAQATRSLLPRSSSRSSLAGRARHRALPR